MSTERLWFVKHLGKVRGPFNSKQLQQLAASGQIEPDHNVRLGNNGAWTTAANIKGLFPTPVVASAPEAEPQEDQEYVFARSPKVSECDSVSVPASSRSRPQHESKDQSSTGNNSPTSSCWLIHISAAVLLVTFLGHLLFLGNAFTFVKTSGSGYLVIPLWFARIIHQLIDSPGFRLWKSLQGE